MQRTDSLEKTLMLGKTEGGRRGLQRMRRLDGITDWKGMSLSKLHKLAIDREAWHAAVHEVTKNRIGLSDWLNWTDALQHYLQQPRDGSNLGAHRDEMDINVVHLYLDSVLESRDITLPTKICIVKAMVFQVVMYRCEDWTIKKAECRKTDAFKLWCWRSPNSLHCRDQTNRS